MSNKKDLFHGIDWEEFYTFADLPEEERADELAIHGPDAETASYIKIGTIFWSMGDCICVDDPDFDGVIGVSNNTGIAVKVSPCCCMYKASYI